MNTHQDKFDITLLLWSVDLGIALHTVSHVLLDLYRLAQTRQYVWGMENGNQILERSTALKIIISLMLINNNFTITIIIPITQINGYKSLLLSCSCLWITNCEQKHQTKFQGHKVTKLVMLHSQGGGGGGGG
ncbi:MAG: hypothetical protein MJE68_31200, partial [Proteobacteria bacterium]|nr:hypothetical protein [Pseudomonadota bacterium]